MGIIGLITDFGARGMHYVAEMKGVALNINSQVQFLDITHEIAPYSTIEAAYVLYTTIPILPASLITICVVDPGVGTDRTILCVQLNSGHIIIGPNNGIFSYFVFNKQIQSVVAITESEFFYTPPNLSEDEIEQKSEVDLKPNTQLSPTDEDLIKMIAPDEEVQKILIPPQKKISTTFHGRDIMSPVAAHLSLGLELFALGDPQSEEDIELISILEPEYHEEEQKIEGLIQYIDAFGNCVTNIPIKEFDMVSGGMRSTYSIKWNGQKQPIQRTSIFAGNDPDFLLLVDGSSGFLEICQNKGNASREMKAIVGTRIEIELTGGDVPFLNGMKST